jgi:hypothetical protein
MFVTKHPARRSRNQKVGFRQELLLLGCGKNQPGWPA